MTRTMQLRACVAALPLLVAPVVGAAPVITTFEAAGADAAAIVAARDAFRAAVGGGAVAGANGSFGGLRREINWDGVPTAFADPNALPANFFNVNSPRGVVFSTPGTGFLVSANAGEGPPTLFGFPSQFQAFSPQRLFTAVNSNVTDVHFFVPGTATAATTTAFGVVFSDVELAGRTKLEFFNVKGQLIHTHDALTAGNQGLTFLGATVSGRRIGSVRITSGENTIAANGVLGDDLLDLVAMDDFLYAEPAAIPEPSTLALAAFGLVGIVAGVRRWRKPQ